MTGYWARFAWLNDSVAERVRLVEGDGRWLDVNAGRDPEAGDRVLPGLVLPGLANTHSHAFHRALRGRTHAGGGTFWTWREGMYRLAGALDPDRYFRLARAVYAEMALAGISVVGEFHYLHHAPGGRPYGEANAFGQALLAAAVEAGIRITLLDTCYLAGGLDADGYRPLDAVQQRFADAGALEWADRVSSLQPTDRARIGAAVHSVRAVPEAALAQVIGAFPGRPLHVHLSEQPAENEATLARFGCTPTELLSRHGFGGPLHTAVHATHLTPSDLGRLGSGRTNISFCPSTERDLADGLGPARALADAGAAITLGTDQNAVIDLLAEAQALEQDERLASLRRGVFRPAELVRQLTVAGHHSLGWADAGELAAGQRADLTALRLDTVRTAGVDPAQAVLVAGAADIDTVIVDGQPLVSGGQHRNGDVAVELAREISALWAG